MPLPPATADDNFRYEPLRASVLDVFEQLGAFDEDSGIVEWMFPEVHEEKQLRRTRVKLTEVFDNEIEPEPETPRKSRLGSRFFGIRTKSRSKSQVRPKKEKEKEKEKDVATSLPKQKPKKTRSSPNLRKEAVGAIDGLPEISSPMKQTPTAVAPTTPENTKSRRISIFPRKPPPPVLEGPRPSISDEEWQQITMTGSIADYEAANTFIGRDPALGPISNRKSNDTATSSSKRSGPFSRFTHTFSRSTPTSPIHEHAPSPPPLPTTPTAPAPSSSPAAAPRDPEVASTHSDTSTDTLQAVPAPDIEEVPRDGVPREEDERLETSSQMDHVRMSLSDISEGEVSETSTVSMKTDAGEDSDDAERPKPPEDEAGSS
ncbi:hypothetical protein C8F01DRAFT_1133761 [Mycena amicta]|nr:hypothetical protein C8F01DRAFT_1133761 [Mycena amicta]